jgi:hypothetical protein
MEDPGRTMSFPKGALQSLIPAKGEGLPFTGGCVGTGCLHVVASGLLIGLGAGFLGQEGSLIVLPFWVFLGLFEWIYLVPVALLLKRLRFQGATKGVWFGGSVAVLLTVLYWTGLGVMGLVYHQKAQEAQEFARKHPLVHHEVTGTIVAADDTRLDVKTDEGVVSIGLAATTHYIRTNGQFGNEAATRAIVRVGSPVRVQATSFDGGPLYADYVNMEVPDTASTR